MPQTSFLSYWGKAQAAEGTAQAWHPLAYHALDVAAVGRTLLERDPALRRWLAGLLGQPEPAAAALLTWLLALHDVGKFSRVFQSMRPDLYVEAGGEAMRHSGIRHDAAGRVLWMAARESLTAPLWSGNGPSARRRLAQALDALAGAVIGHHGRPCDDAGDVLTIFAPADRAAAMAFAGEAAALLWPEAMVLDPVPEPERFRMASWSVAGFAVACDWLGSYQPFFPYRAPGPGLDDYWREEALPRAATAVDQAGLLPARPAAVTGFGALFEGLGEATPLQLWAESCALPEGPGLFVIEELTGAGKTEAALVLAHRLIADGVGAGLYVALPTMAMANAMYDRVAVAYRRLFSADRRPSLVLSHGARDLHDRFQDSVLPIGDIAEAGYGADEAETASVACAGWIAADRRRAFLADIGVGTVDQALLAVLPNRFQSLRLHGLARRVLILDEVHAYDAYVQGEIAALLKFHAALGGSAILLSATLPRQVRHRLLDAYRAGRVAAGAAPPDLPPMAPDYPLATVLDDAGCRQNPVAARTEAARRLPVRFLAGENAAAAEVIAAARSGRAACWIRNTVHDALAARDLLAGQGVSDVILFHARFALSDRLAIEAEVLRRFGKGSGVADRRGRVLIATQVAEQSLDLDFDVMVSDLAPIDLLIQRAGRLWRHDWRKRDGNLELLVVVPEPAEDAGADWYTAAFPKAGAVYRDHGGLWLTADTLRREGALDLPARMRDLVEAVYDPANDPKIPEALRRSRQEAQGAALGDRSTAHYSVLDLEGGYTPQAGQWDSDVVTPTRLGEPQVTLRLARWQDGRLEPWAEATKAGDDRDPWRAWRSSEVTVRERLVAGAAPRDGEVGAAITAVIAAWPRWEREIPVVVLTPGEDGAWHGEGVDPEGKPVGLAYDSLTGLQIETNSARRT